MVAIPNIFLIIVAVLLPVILFVACLFFLVYFSSSDDKNQAWLPKIIVVRAIFIISPLKPTPSSSSSRIHSFIHSFFFVPVNTSAIIPSIGILIDFAPSLRCGQRDNVEQCTSQFPYRDCLANSLYGDFYFLHSNYPFRYVLLRGSRP